LVEPRLVLRHAQRPEPAEIDVVGEPARYLAAALNEVARPLAGHSVRELGPVTPMDHPRELGPVTPLDHPGELGPVTPMDHPGGEDQVNRSDHPRGEAQVNRPDHPRDQTRVMLDRRGQSPLAVLADALAAGGDVLAVCSDVPRRLTGLRERCGGFALACHHALECDPELTRRFEQIVVLDPPDCAESERRLAAGSGFTHLAWGPAELRFAQQIHELEYGLRTSLTALFRSLRQRQRAAGGELEHLLRGDGQHGRPARLAGRLIRVLVELELVSLDRDLPALAIASAAPTKLERSPAYRVYEARYEDGRKYLNSANPRPIA
jgi:single-stranded-DNA-specific exonuclease